MFLHLFTMSRTITHELAHRHHGRSVCHYCAGAWLPERQNTRLNESTAMSLADYIDSLDD